MSAWDPGGRGLRPGPSFAGAPKLLAACQSVVANWEQGDLAQAARLCAEAAALGHPRFGRRPKTTGRYISPWKNWCVEYYRLGRGIPVHGTRILSTSLPTRRTTNSAKPSAMPPLRSNGGMKSP